MSKTIFGPSLNVKIGFRLSKCNISQFECQNRISSVKRDIRPQFECHNAMIDPSLNVFKK